MASKSKAGAAGLMAAGALAGGILMASIGANAATGTSTSTASAPAATTPAPAGSGAQGYGAPTGAPAGGPQGQNPNESPVTGANLATLKAAALKAVPGGTVDRVETDSGDAAYEAHMTKADGTRVTVKFDKSLAVVNVEDGMGK